MSWQLHKVPGIAGPPSRIQDRMGGTRGAPVLQPQVSDTSLGMGQCWAGIWAHRWAWLSRTHGWAGQTCEDLDTCPAVEPQGPEMGSWAMSRVGEVLEDVGRDSQG